MRSVINFFKGIAISVSTIVPGVSGGTMAIILGVYDDLIHAIGSFFEDWKKHSKLILELGIGGVLGIALFSRAMENLLGKYPLQMGFLFIGVVIGGIPILYKRATQKDTNKSNYLYLLVGLAIALMMSFKPDSVSTMAAAGDIKGIIFLFIAGIIIAVALILPGISGSFMLLILGLYDITLRAINNFDVKFLIPIGIGAVLGTFATTKTIETLLNKYPGKTYMLILGFVLGSIVPIYPGIPQGIELVNSSIALIAGCVFIYFIGKREN